MLRLRSFGQVIFIYMMSLTIGIAVYKLVANNAVPWWVVLLPMWLPIFVAISSLVLLLVATAICGWSDDRKWAEEEEPEEIPEEQLFTDVELIQTQNTEKWKKSVKPGNSVKPQS